MFLHAVGKSPSAEAEISGGIGLIAGEFSQYAQDQIFFESAQVDSLLRQVFGRNWLTGILKRQELRQVDWSDFGSRGEQYETLTTCSNWRTLPGQA